MMLHVLNAVSIIIIWHWIITILGNCFVCFMFIQGYFGIQENECTNQDCCWNPADVSQLTERFFFVLFFYY